MKAFAKIYILPSESGWQTNFEAVEVNHFPTISMTATRMADGNKVFALSHHLFSICLCCIIFYAV